MSECAVLFAVAFTMTMKGGNGMGGWNERGEGRRVEGAGGQQHLFSVRLMLYL